MNNKAIIGGFLWQYVERFSVQSISFIVTIILARLLMPEEYGIVSIASIFITLLEVFVTSGWSNALVQKKTATRVDFSSVFYFNLFFSLFLFIGVLLLAPAIGGMYSGTKVAPVLQLMSFRIVISSFNSIQQAYVQRNLLFKRQFYSSLVGTIASAILGVGAAYNGFGVYALVIQYLSYAALNTLILFLTIKWRPTLDFSWQRLKGLLKYGWKLLGAGLLNTLFAELKGFIIGGRYSSSDLAYYDKGKQFPSLIYDNLNTSIGKVLFPLMSQAQDDVHKIQNMTRISLQIMSAILLPVLYILFAIGNSMIDLLLTDKWLPAVPFLRITCVTFSLVIPNTVFTNAINAIGRSDLHLKVEIINIMSGVLILLAFMNLGTLYIAFSVTLSNLVCLIVRLVICYRLFDMTVKNFVSDFLKPYMCSIWMAAILFLMNHYLNNNILELILCPLVGFVIYILLLYFMNRSIMCSIVSIINHLR